eukprot:TRINITY_DN4261_c0_g1_i1.p1 TRINITY_DN4261_c0_g1~~TRINITY_DN4261_c0_g1_i1.p1  ORF type:complete len:555 (+),score=48.18 TRINITY_DN4261_c0_g1_i1:212-1666(+)
MGDQMWEFIIPIVLIDISPQTLLPPALFGLVVELSNVILIASFGKQIDKKDRLDVVRYGTLGQAMFISISATFLFLLQYYKTPDMVDNIFATWKSSLFTIALFASASLCTLFARVMSIAVEKDWVPMITNDEARLTLLNSRMRTVDLLTEVLGPLIAGALPLIPTYNLRLAFLTIAVLNFVSFFPQLALLTSVYDMLPSLRMKEPLEEDEIQRSTCYKIFLGDWNPFANLIRAGSEFVKQPVSLVVIAYAFLWLTVLSPHDVIFTAYLKSINYKEWELGLFRASGALFGVLSTILFPWAVGKIGISAASMIFIFWEGACLAVGGVLIHFYTFTRVLFRVLFLVVIVLSRPGLYGFGIGEVQLCQLGVAENKRGIIGSVETSLTSLATLLTYIAGIVARKPENFKWLMWGSIACVNTGVLLFALWNMIWSFQTKMHSHHSIHNERHHIQLHTKELEDELNGINSMHTHPYFRRRGKQSNPARDIN